MMNMPSLLQPLEASLKYRIATKTLAPQARSSPLASLTTFALLALSFA
jgi:hypothetical protein